MRLLRCNLSDITRPALSFVSAQRFKSTLWHAEILRSLEDFIVSFREDIVGVVRLILPNLVEGWFRQRGDVFGFGDYNHDSKMLLLEKDMQKLNQAAVRFLKNLSTISIIE